MVDIVVKDWCKFKDLFCKLFLIMCHDGQWSANFGKIPKFCNTQNRRTSHLRECSSIVPGLLGGVGC